jgi:hypothetical protein
MTQLQEIVRDFATAFKAVDASGPRGRSKSREYEPGIGPLTENEAVRLATEWLKGIKPDTYASGVQNRTRTHVSYATCLSQVNGQSSSS